MEQLPRTGTIEDTLRRREIEIHYLRKQIGVWAKELTKILEGHFEIASSDNLQTVKMIRSMEAMAVE